MIDILVAQLKKAGPELANNYCIVNGNVLYLNQVENMKLEEYSARSIYSLPNKIYKFFPDTETEDEDGNEVNYSDKALKSNEVYLSSPNDFDDVFDSEITVSWEEFEAFRMKKLCFVFFVFTKDANLDFRIFAVIAILQQEFYGILKFVFQLQAFNVRSNKIIWEGSVLIFRFLELVRINIRVLPDEQIEPRVRLL